MNYTLRHRVNIYAVSIYCIIPDGSQLLHKNSARIKVVPLVTRNAKVVENLPAFILSARVSCRFAGRPSNTRTIRVPFV